MSVCLPRKTTGMGSIFVDMNYEDMFRVKKGKESTGYVNEVPSAEHICLIHKRDSQPGSRRIHIHIHIYSASGGMA